MTRPTVSQVEAWRPESLRRLADGWDEAVRRLAAHVDTVSDEIRRSRELWTGTTADAAQDNARAITSAGDDAARSLVLASAAARDGADQIAAALMSVRTLVAEARDGGFDVADDGTVTIRAGPPPLLVALSGGDPAVAHDMFRMRADTLSQQITDALDQLGVAEPTPPATSRKRSRRHRSPRPPRRFRLAHGRFRHPTWWRDGPR
ncbi:MAG TPA: hypothetical protein VHJ79_09570 [Mycobacterium sp.]|nr:hypothetical protein [Mycobacterium sp.]